MKTEIKNPQNEASTQEESICKTAEDFNNLLGFFKVLIRINDRLNIVPKDYEPEDNF